MKKIALTVAALAVTAGSALAADLPSRKGPPMLPPPPPPPLWTGFYVGLNAGGTWGNNNSITVASTNFFNNTPILSPLGTTYGPAAALATSGVINGSSNSGFIGGGQVGYNWQFYNSFLVGVEADIQGIAGSSSGNRGFVSAVDRSVFAPIAPGNLVVASVAARANIDYIGTVRGRLGWLATPTLLIYGTGGLAYGGVNASVAMVGGQSPNTGSSAFLGSGAFSDTRTGWTAGGGVEWMFWPNWSAKVEYLYYDLGRVTFNSSATAASLLATGDVVFGNAHQVSGHFSGNIVRAGLNYHFNWGAPAPVVAKY
jgi:outer membrane immunogenic protein